MNQITQDIKLGQFQKIYLLFGEEAYLREQFAKRLVNSIVGDDSMNCTYFKGRETDVSQVISIADTLPFFAERRVVVIEDSGFFKKESKELADYLENMPDTTTMIFRESDVDKRNRLYKKVKDLGYPAEMKRQTDRELERWVLQMLQKEQIQITSSNMQFFLQCIGNDMYLLKNEVEKLISYLGEKKVVERNDIEAICSVQVTGHIFDMIDAMSRHNQKMAMRLYYDLIQLKEPPMRILYLVNRQYMQLYQIKELMEQGQRGKELAISAGLSPYIANKVCQKAEAFTLEELQNCMSECLLVDEGIKTGLIKDQIAVEMLIVKLSS
jgi:DNA polymerase-3 subunit delta